ncbi:hypothetical protein VOM14_18695 [Paraburkholderia sp. MPAMCS5]|uniref:hypothetical protein n=1 Tax=Paraburkholderia sp. MPAMCS5 TaxID=3112563 RepID=UPI002E1834D7|nr:hypothetical protein [Paraburkholderia sp. MPAMCS5]
MGKPEQNSEEAAAVARVANAAREVQLASQAIEEKFNTGLNQSDRTLLLARLTAAITELQAARDALDALLARKSFH